MKIATVGLWHLGTVTAACLATGGHSVVAFDDDPSRVAALQRYRLPVAEPGLDDLMRQTVESGKLRFSSDTTDLRDAEIVWITYDTPVDEDDRANVEFVVTRVIEIFPYLRSNALVLISSQLPVGTTRRLAEMYQNEYPQSKVSFAYSPENLRLGKAIDVFMRPDRVVVGVSKSADRERLAILFKAFTDKIEWMAVESAEMTKHALNAFLATSVTFANEIGTLCERVGADAREVERGLKSDTRIGPRAYVRPGYAFAGGTLARDISFLVDMGVREQMATHLLAAVRVSNQEHKHWAQQRLSQLFHDLRDKRIAVLGLTYKPDTDTLRRSSAVETCQWLNSHGARVAVYDPVVKTLPPDLAFIQLCDSIESVLLDADAALVATEWREFAALRADQVVAWMRQPIVLDAARFLEKNLGTDKRIRFVAVGKPG